MEQYKQFIKDAYNGKKGLDMCGEWKELIKNEFPELVENKLEVGKWYKDSYYNRSLYCITQIYKRKFHFYGFNIFGNWTDEDYYDFDKSILTPATNDEIKSALIKEALKRNFKEGYKFKNLGVRDNGKWVYINKKVNFEYSNGELCIERNDLSRVLYKNGKWAEITSQTKKMTVEQISKELGYDVEIIKG